MRVIAGILAAIGWFALVLQFRLVLGVNANAGIGPGETFVRFFSYFTVLTNTLAASALTSVMLGHSHAFLTRPRVQTAIAVYITIVGSVYFLILRHLWQPQGPQWLADTLLHYVMPALYVLFWLFFVRKETIIWRDSLVWLIFPLAYVCAVLARGVPSKFYPYPFIDANELGYLQIAGNSAVLLAAFLAAGVLYVAISRSLSRKAGNALN
ncbi:MAG TPA: Pr6Pr family membrane protein [Xanthobacteraceae bacterium]|nr:Pr6Pr family membrane protein [Xanthobacteraceae bacterium]